MKNTPEKRKYYRTNARRKILDLYGRQCYNCGFNKDERVLQLDHIDSKPNIIKGRDGGTPRSGLELYSAILSGSVPSHMFQILCANCNYLKRLITPAESTNGVKSWSEDFIPKNSELVESEIIG